MQCLLDICSDYADRWCIKYNEKKSKLMFFGRSFSSFTSYPITMNGKALDFVSEWNYLGVVIRSGMHFSCSPKKCTCSYYRSVNTILNIVRRPSEIVMMKLLYSISIPILTYACDVKVFSSKEMTQLHVAANDAIQKIFTYNRWESVKTLREGLGYRSITEIFASRKASFERNLPSLGNATLSYLYLNY